MLKKPTSLLRGLAALMLLGPLTPLWAQSATPDAPQATCPPQATAPTPQQLHAARAQAQDRGALWRISRDGRVSWLYGTLHLGKLEWAMPGPKLTQALLSVDAVALEIDVSDPDTQAQLIRSTSAPPAALQERLAKQLAAACVPADALAALHPVLQVMVLGSLDARWIGLDPGYGIEHVLTGFARARKLPLIALETPAIQMQALIPAQPEDVQRLLDLSLTQLESGLTRRVMARLVQAWAEGDLDAVSTYEDWCDCITGEDDRAALRRINDDRNPHMSDRIATLHGEGRRLFAAVGLLHMTGAQALPKLLAERGFTVERVPLH